MAVIFWTQADGWAGPNTSSGDLSTPPCSALSKVGTSSAIDTVRGASCLSGAGYTNSWKISGLSALNDRAVFGISLPFSTWTDDVLQLSASAVFVIPTFDACAKYKEVQIMEVGDCVLRLSRRTNSPGNNASTYLQLNANQSWGTVNTNLFLGDLHQYAIGEPGQTPLLIEVDVNFAVGQTIKIRLYDYSNPDSPSQIGSEYESPAIQRAIPIETAAFGGKVTNSVSGTVDDFYLSEFQIRDRAGHHVRNPYIGYPSGSTFKEEDFSDAELLTADDDWKHYDGDSTLTKTGSDLRVAVAGESEAAVLETNPVLAQGHAVVTLSNMQSDDKAGLVFATHRFDFDPTTGANTPDGTIDPGYYRAYVENTSPPNLVVDLVVDGVVTPIDSTSITSGTANGTLTVYNRESGVNARLLASFDNGSIAPFTAKNASNTDIFPAQWGVYMAADAGSDLSSALSNFSVVSQYSSDYTFYELARYCDGVKAENLFHAAVVQSPKYNQTVIVIQAGLDGEASKDSKIFAWVVPLEGVSSESDILGPVELDAGDELTYRAHNPSGGTFDGRAVLLWGRDSWGSLGIQSPFPGVKEICGVVHAGGLNFIGPDGNNVSDVGYSPVMTVGNDADGNNINGYRIHFKGHGFQSGSELIMPGIKTYDLGSTAPSTVSHGMITLHIPVSGTSLGTVTGGHISESGNIGEWAIYPENDTTWWAWGRSSTGTTPAVLKSEAGGGDAIGDTWVLQTGAGQTYFPALSSVSAALDGQTLGGGEYVFCGPIQPQPSVDPVASRKMTTALPVSANTVFDSGWQTDRADEIVLLWNWTNIDNSASGRTGYGQVTSTPAGNLMACFSRRTSSALVDLSAQLILIQIPQSVSGYTPWENTFLGSGGAGRMGLEMDLLL